MKDLMRGVWDLLAPRRCPGCDLFLMADDAMFCEVCWPLVERARYGPSVFLYGGPMAEAIRRLKYARRLDYVGPLGQALAEGSHDHRGRVDVVVPVPLHRSRRVQRGFDQAALLAAPVAQKLGVPLRRGWLQRTRATAVQAGLSAELRHENTAGAFAVTESARGFHRILEKRPQAVPPRVLLVDDVMTTGATLESASEALLRAGVKRVRRLCLARRE